MRTNIFAYTPPTGPGYPPYVSINRLDSGDVEVTVRGAPTVVIDDGHAQAILEGDTIAIVVPAAEWKLGDIQ